MTISKIPARRVTASAVDRRRMVGLACGTVALYACGDEGAKRKSPPLAASAPAANLSPSKGPSSCLFALSRSRWRRNTSPAKPK